MASEGLQKLFEDLRAVVLEAEAALERGAAEAHALAEEAAPASTEAVAAVADAVGAGVNRGLERSARYVRQNPWLALGLAAAVGFAAGVAARRR